MFSNVSNKLLSIIFGVLLLLVLVIVFWNGDANERTFRDELVSIDTSSVTEIKIFPKTTKHEEVRLFKDGAQWKVELENGSTAAVPARKIQNVFTQLLQIKPKRLAARDEAKWTDFQVDTTGTRLEVWEDGDKTLNIILGRFQFQQPRSMSTYVRLSGDTDVYEVDGFLDMTFNKNAESFRDERIVRGTFNGWNKLSFNYPADSSFQIVKVDGKWTHNGAELDSANTEKYLRQLSNLNGTEFVNVDENTLPATEMYLDIEKGDGNTIRINAYKNDAGYTIHSTDNAESFFNGTKNDLTGKIFVGLKKFHKN
ncbi:MAG: DUF4340 domain-containing protein [Melioribacteraceae bacterium]|nr:DUF4340 domain-containing protein [Melioribacteraceae bacterium]MCF8355785.1 DUF4340 domain-containing protein [Melioribacteraceae bacterium]MCF8392825.1 DUF4340 domain-containing protein [Melioribacteraceae bacterium]MCF8418689.1 DUF4340 domain-containing protein [Melioribacteraceae bacterium]